MIASVRFVACVLVSIACCQLLADEPSSSGSRTWTDNTGKFKLDASFVKLDGGEVHLLKSDGKIVRVPLQRLSIEDRQQVAALIKRTPSDSHDGSLERIGSAVVFVTVVDRLQREVGFGSGFVIDRKGIVATNHHVVRDAAKVYVQFRDGAKLPVLGYLALDPDRDLTLLQIDGVPPEMHVLSLETRKPPRQGDSVLAVGHPQGFKYTLSRGTVNALRKTADLPPEVRLQLKSPDDTTWIQTDSVIAAGSSGGPLFNQKGHVIGVNSWTADQANLGFAIHVEHLLELKKKTPSTAKPKPFPIQQPLSDDPLNPIDDEVAKLLTHYNRSFEEFALKVQQAPPARQAALVREEDPRLEFGQKFFKLAQNKRKSRQALQALALAAQLCADDSSKARKLLDRVTGRLLEDHLQTKALGAICIQLIEAPMPPSPAFFQRVLDDSPHRETRGLACLALASSKMRASDDGRAREEVLKLLERVSGEFGSVPFGPNTLKQIAEPMIYQVKYLSIGSTARNIVGKDVDGKQLKLSDYKGKVVMLDFFADWCPFCVQMYPHERMLVKKYKDKPFAVLGVNCDGKSTLKQIIKEEKVTWPSWSDGPGGPIAQEWHVFTFPTIYILDRQGVIRYRFDGSPGKALDDAIEKLLEESPAK